MILQFPFVVPYIDFISSESFFYWEYVLYVVSFFLFFRFFFTLTLKLVRLVIVKRAWLFWTVTAVLQLLVDLWCDKQNSCAALFKSSYVLLLHPLPITFLVKCALTVEEKCLMQNHHNDWNVILAIFFQWSGCLSFTFTYFIQTLLYKGTCKSM